jgi:hypothetical protein
MRPLEVVMTRPSLASLLFGCVLAVPLAACSSTPSVDETAAEAGVSSTQTDGGGNSSSSDADSGGNPGGPGGDRDTGGGGGGGGGGNPGAPGDLAVFEEAGVAHSVLRDDAATKCADGACTLLDPVPTAGNPENIGGLDECIIRDKSDIHYNPPAQNGRFSKGATVQAQVDCTDENSAGSEGNGTGESGTTDESGTTGESQAPDSGTSDGSTPSDEPQA